MSVLDEVHFPTDWAQAPLGRCFRRSQEANASTHEPLSVYLGAGVVRRADRSDNYNELGADLGKYLLVREGDLVFNKLRTWQGGFGASSYEGIVSPAYFVCRPNANVSARFVDHQLHSAPFLAELVRISKWQPPTQFDTPWDQLRALRLALPPRPHQDRIAAFLDRETDRIDRLRQRQNDFLSDLSMFLDAQRQEVADRHARSIQPLQTVVDPARPVMYGIVLPGEPVEDGVLLVKGGNVERNDLRATSLVKVDREIERRYARARLTAGDLLMTIRGSFGAVAIVPAELEGANITQDSARISTARHVDARWVMHMLRAPSVQRQLSAMATGAGVKGVNIRDLRRVRLPVPERVLQRTASAELDELERRAAALRDRARQFDGRLAAYREALLTEAVTGTLDVDAVQESDLQERAEAALEGVG